MARTRTHIEGDLKAATREVERLQAELAAVPADSIKVAGTVFGGRQVGLSRKGRDCVLCLDFYDNDTRKQRQPNVYLKPSEAGELRDWLNHYFPKEAS